ncbi:nucleotide exchange factor GrpE [Thiotrichales bacterium 19S9-12]|nr:nucleotide exchange factor GrpE [Thiotrichales bacterium 19S9-11]MCF6811981.1 nucleotide exchange factor GrpE [Thiotrichales bacterium 19S9-12]
MSKRSNYDDKTHDIDIEDNGLTEEISSNETTTESGNKSETLKLAEKVDQLYTQLENEQKKAHKSEDKALRLHAEMENLRKRTERDIENAHKFALEKCLKELIPVVDSMEHACDVSSDDEQVLAMQKGVQLTMKMLIDTLAKFGVEQINPEGDKFDPLSHEAMSTQPNDKVDANTVIHVLQKGYRLNDRVVRPARVIVSVKSG